MPVNSIVVLSLCIPSQSSAIWSVDFFFNTYFYECIQLPRPTLATTYTFKALNHPPPTLFLCTHSCQILLNLTHTQDLLFFIQTWQPKFVCEILKVGLKSRAMFLRFETPWQIDRMFESYTYIYMHLHADKYLCLHTHERMYLILEYTHVRTYTSPNTYTYMYMHVHIQCQYT